MARWWFPESFESTLRKQVIYVNHLLALRVLM